MKLMADGHELRCHLTDDFLGAMIPVIQLSN